MLLEALARQLRARDDAGLARRRRIAETACAARQTFTIGHAPPRSLLNFAGNDYLGLAEHPWVVAAWIDGARRYGAGSGGSHLLGGHSRAHATLEDELGALLAPCIPKARALFFGTGYLANLAVVGALPKLAQVDATLYCDSLNHASLIDGARLSGVPREIYPHRDLPALEALLAAGRAPLKFIVTDAVFSMDGDIADIAGLLALAERHDAWLVVDDAHGFGVHGRQGRGSLDLAGVRSERLLCIGTLGKAAGVAGAFVAAHPTVVEALLQCARPYVYTTAAPSAIAHALLASLRIITGTEGDARRARWRERAAQLRAGWPGLLPSATPIQPLVVGDASAAVRLSTALEGEGLLVPAIRPPTVPDGTARLRISLSAAHTAADVEQLLGGLRRHADALATVAA